MRFSSAEALERLGRRPGCGSLPSVAKTEGAVSAMQGFSRRSTPATGQLNSIGVIDFHAVKAPNG